MRQQCGLRVVRARELLRRPLEAERRERRAEGGIDLIQDLPRGRISPGEVLGHAGLLRALSGEQEEELHAGVRVAES